MQAGEPLLELETDKATTVVPAPGSGVLKIGVAEGETVAIGATVGTIDPAGAAVGRRPRLAAGRQSARRAARTARRRPPAARRRRRSGDQGAGDRPLSPSVRRLVAEQDVDVAGIAGTGPGGRITKGDVLGSLGSSPAAAPAAPAAPAAAPRPATPWPTGHGRSPHRPRPRPPAPAPSAGPRETRQRMSGLRQRIAQRLVEAQQTAAILTTFNEADMSRVMELRAHYKEPFQKAHGTALGFMSFFVKAAIEALRRSPRSMPGSRATRSSIRITTTSAWRSAPRRG